MIAGTLEIQLLANLARLQKDMDDAKRAVGGAMSSIEGSVAAAKSALQGLAAGLSVAAFAGMIKGAVDLADNLNDLSKTTGLAVTQLAGLKLAAKQSGGDLEGIAASINKLSVAMGKESERFAKLGITAKDPLEAFKQLADVFSAIQDPQLRAALGAEALGKSWASAAPLLSEGSKNIAEMVAKGAALSGVTQDMADKADHFNDMMAELEAATNGAKMKLADEMLPAMTDITTAIMQAYEESGKLQAVWVALGALGAFASTDQFSTATVKIGKLREDLAKLEEQKFFAENQPMVGAIPRWLFGSSDVNGDIAKTKAAIADLQAQIDKPSKDAAQRPADAEAKKKADAESAEASRKAAEFLKLQGDAEKARAAAAKAANEEAKKQQDILAKLSGYTGSYGEDVNRLASMLRNGKLSQEAYNSAVNDLVNSQPGMKAALDERAKATKDSAKMMDEAAKAARDHSATLAKDLATLDESNRRQADYNQEIGLTAEALNTLRLSRLDDALATQEQVRSLMSLQNSSQEEIDAIEQRIKLLKEQRSLTAQGQDKEVSSAAAKSAAEEWKRASEQINQSLTDALMRGWESGKSFAENFRDTAVNMFKTMVLRPVISAVLNPISMGLTGMMGMSSAANAAGGVADGAAAINGASMLTSMKGWLTDFGGSVASKAGDLGSWLSTSSNSSLQELGGAIGRNTKAIGQFGTYAGYAAAAVNALDAASKGKWGQAIGTGVGAIWGPLGSMAGGAIGSWVDSAFGGGHEYTTGSGLSGTFSGSGFSGRNYQDWRNDGSSGFFGIGGSGSSSGTNYSAIDSAQAKAFSAAFANIKTQTADFADALGLSAATVQGFSKSIRVSLGGDAEANKKAIADMFQGIANEAAATVLDAQYIREGEAAADTLARLATNLTVVNGSLDTLGKTLLSTSQASGDMASALVDQMGGLQQFQSSIASYYQTYYSDEERLAKTREQTAAAFAALGIAMPDTLQSFRDLVTVQDLTTESGRSAYAALIGLSGAFASITSTVDSLTPALVETAKGIKSLMDSIGSQRSAVAGAASSINPSPVMSLADILAGVGGINTTAPTYNAPSRSALDAATAKVITAEAARAAASLTVNAKTAALSAADAAKATTIAYYQQKAAQFQNMASGYGVTANYSGYDNAAYGYNASTNSLNPWNSVGYTNTSSSSLWGSLFGGNTSTSGAANATAFKVAAYGGTGQRDANGWLVAQAGSLVDILSNGNTALANVAGSAVAARSALTTAQAALSNLTAAKTTADVAAAAAAKAYTVAVEKATLQYAQAVDAWTAEASKSVPALSKLREETLRYFESQKALSEQMIASSGNLRAAVASAKATQLDSSQLLGMQQRQFGTNNSLALSSTGSVQASYADKMAAALPDLASGLMSTAKTREEWVVATQTLYAQSERVAALLESTAPMDYQAESLSALATIDNTLAMLDDSTRAITRAIESSGTLTAAGLRQVVTALGGTPSFDVGTNYVPRDMFARIHEGEAVVPRAFNPAAGARMGGMGNTSRLEALVEKQALQLEGMRAELRAIAVASSSTAKTLRDITPNRTAIATEPAA